MTKEILIISSSRADRSLLAPVSERLGDDCEFRILEWPITYDKCKWEFEENDAGRKVVLLGDRWETCLLAFHAIECDALIYHIHGGEVTAGSKDEIYRHSITKMSHVHLVCHQDFADRVIKMGEPKINVFNVGSLGVWRAKHLKDNGYFSFDGYVDIKNLKPHLTVILHPNTIEPDKTESEVSTLLDALKSFSGDFRIKFYAPNYDSGREIISRKIKAFIELFGGEYVEEEYGDDFLNSLKHSACIIGNSSCGIIEAPSLKTPTVNIGTRQDGRPMAKSIFNCDFDRVSIESMIFYATEYNGDFTNQYDNTEQDTVEMICDILRNHPVSFSKRFVD